jgi:hypothetical protein
MACRVKTKLKSGEIAVTGDQWPVFLYTGYSYDPEDPWNGLLQSNILISVSRLLYTILFIQHLILGGFRRSNTYLRPRVR